MKTFERRSLWRLAWRCSAARVWVTVVAVAGLAGVAASAEAASAAGAGTALSKADYRAHQRQIETDFKTEREACNRWAGNDKDVCVARAQGHEAVAKAELDFNNTGDPRDASRLAVVKARAHEALAREQCNERPTHERLVCLRRQRQFGPPP